MSVNRKKREERMSARSTAEARSKGGGFSAFDLPSHVSILKLKPGRIKLDVVPHRAGSSNLFVPKGKLAAEVIYYVHKSVGPSEALVVCPREMKKSQRCACCELHSKMREDPDANKDAVNALKAKRRIALLVQVTDKPEDGVHLLDQAYFKSFGALLDDQIKQSIADGEDRVDSYADPDEGMTMRLNVAEDTFNGRTFSQVTAVSFIERKSPLSDDILEKAFSLDDALKIPTYAETVAALSGGDEDDDDEDEPAPKAKPKAKAKAPVDDEEDDDEDDDDEDDDDDEPAPKAKPKAKAKAPVDDDDDDDEDDDEPAPKVKPKAKPKAKAKAPVDEDDDDEDDWDDDEPVAKTKAKPKAKAKAPVDGDDWDDDDDDDEPAPKVKPKAKPKAKAPVDDDDDEPAPKAKPKPKAKAKAPVDDDDWDDDTPF